MTTPTGNSSTIPAASAPLRVCSFESRKQEEMRSLIERHGGLPTVAASMREVPLENNVAVFAFLERLRTGTIDAVVFMTGVGAKALLEVVESRMDRATFFEQLRCCCLIVRGPKPTAVLREWGVRIDHRAPEPNTWHELLAVIDAGLKFPTTQSMVATSPQRPLEGRTIAIQEYGLPNGEFYEALRNRGAEIIAVPVYRWELPSDTAPLEAAIRGITRCEFDVLLFTSAQQIRNVLEVADHMHLRKEFLDSTQRCVIGSIGPTCSEALRDAGLHIDLEPSHPHMGHLVRETLARATNAASQT